jgi:RNA polymerase sigma-70 factor (ECF subfamily)
MTLRDMTFSDVDRLGVDGEAIAGTMSMDEEAFRGFYERTARILWAYLSRATGEPQVADDLLQEAYYRLLRARVEFTDETHRRHYLFRIATNLVRDRRRRPMRELPLPDLDDDRLHPTDDGLDAAVVARRDVGRALDALRPRDRDLLWLAYALGLSHQEIAANLNVRPGSVRMLLFRARARLVQLLSPARDVVVGEK